MGLNLSSVTSVLALPFSLLGVSFQDLGQVSCLQEGVYLVDLKQIDCQSFLQQRWISRELWRGAKLATLGLPWWFRWWIIRLQYRGPVFNPWVGKIPWRREQLPTPVSLSGEFMDRGAWRTTVRGVSKNRTRSSDYHRQHACLSWGLFQTGNNQRPKNSGTLTFPLTASENLPRDVCSWNRAASETSAESVDQGGKENP